MLIGKHQMHTTDFLIIQFVKLQVRTFFKVKLYSEEKENCQPVDLLSMFDNLQVFYLLKKFNFPKNYFHF